MYVSFNMRALLPLLLFALALALPGSQARAGGSTWSGAGADNNWSTGANWGGTAPTNDGTAAITFAGTARLTPNVDANWNITGITFSNTAGSFTIGGSQLTLHTGGGGGLTNNSTSAETINNAIVLAAAQSWNAASGNLVIGGNVNNAGFLLTFTGNLGTTINGAISGGAGLTQNGNGMVTLAGNNSYTGVTTISKGTLQFAKANSLYGGTTSSWTPANVVVANGANVVFNVGGTGEFTSSNVTTLLSNLTTVNNNGLKSGSSIGFDTTNAAGGTFTIANNIGDSTGGGGGAIEVTKLGGNTLILSGNNTYTGGASIDAGALNIQSNTALGGAAGVATVASGAQLQLQNGISVANAITISGNGLSNDGALRNISGSNTLSGTVTLGANSYIGAAAGTLTLSGVIAGNGMGLTIVGSGTVAFSGSSSNTYTGATEVQSGTLLLSKSGGGKAIAGPLTIDTGALVQYAAANQIPAVAVTLNGTGHLDLNGFNETSSGGLTFTGGSVTTGAGVLTLGGSSANITTNASSSTATISGNINLGTADRTFTTASGTAGTDLSISAAIAGSHKVIKAGAGILNFSGANTYTGSTTINAGTLQFAKEVSLYNNTAASWTAANLIVASGATAAFNVGGTGEFTSSNLDTLKALGTGTGGFESGSALGIDTTNASGGTFTYSSNIANPNGGANVLGITKLGTGTLVLSGANTYTGAITVSSGNLQITTFTLTTTGPATIASGATLTSTGVLNLTPSTTSAQTYIGGAGTLNLRNTSSTASSPDIYYDPTGGSGAGYGVTIASNVDVGTGNRFINGKSNRNDYERYGGDLIFSGNLTGSANLTFTGTPNTATGGPWQTAYVLQGNNSAFTGGIILTDGANLILNSANALTAANTVTFTPATGAVSGLYLYGRSMTIGALSGTAAGTMNIRNGSLVTDINSPVNSGIVRSNAVLTVQQNTNTTFNGIISDGPNDHGAGDTGIYYTLGLIKTGAGSLTLGGTNTYSGGTTINGGTIVVNSASSLGASSGGLTINAGTLEVSTGYSTTRAITLGDTASTFQIDPSQTFTVTTAIGGTGSLNKTGSGTMVLGATETYNGSTNVSAGTLQINASGSISNTSHVTVNSGGTLLMNGNNNINNSNANATLNGGAIAVGASNNSQKFGTLTLSATSTIDFSTFTNNTLRFANSSGIAWSGTLNVYDYTQGDALYFGNSNSGLTSGQLGEVAFYSGEGTGFLSDGIVNSVGQVTPIPEPSSVFAGLGLLSLAAYRERRRLIRWMPFGR